MSFFFPDLKNTTTDNNLAYQIAALAFGPQPNSASEALNEHFLSEKQKNAIREILKNVSACTRVQMQNSIFSILHRSTSTPEPCEGQKAAMEAFHSSPTNTLKPCEGQKAARESFLEAFNPSPANTPELCGEQQAAMEPCHSSEKTKRLPIEIFMKILESYDELEKQILPLSLTCNHLYGEQPQLCIPMLKITKCLSLKELRSCQRILGVQPNTWNDVFKHCEQLQELDFSGGYPESYVLEYQPEIITILMSAKKHCPLLTRFNFSRCYDMGPRAFEILVKNFPITSLNFSKMISPALLSLQAIRTIADNCPHLRELDLSGNEKFDTDIRDPSMLYLANRCSALAHLKIPCAVITELGLNYLKDCKNLVFLELGDCVRTTVSLEQIQALKEALPNLELKIPEETLKAIAENDLLSGRSPVPEDSTLV